MSQNIIALVGDLVASRKIPQRETFDGELLNTLAACSQQNPDILSPYTLIGDEIQAVYCQADHIFVDAFRILATIYPQQMRFSFGIGTLIKPINPERATEMDGPAFYAARDGVNLLKESGYLLTIQAETLPSLPLMQSSLTYLSHHVQKWTHNRTIITAHLLQNVEIKEIAAELNISVQAVYKNIQAGALDTVLDMLTATTDQINRSM